MARTTDFTQGLIKKPVLMFALPIFLGNVLQQIYLVADSIIVSRMIGPDALAAVSSSTVVVMAIIIIMNGFAAGVSILTAQLYGAKKEKQVTDMAYSTILTLSLASVTLSIIGIIFAKPFLSGAMGIPQEILPDAITYYNICISGTIFVFIYNMYSFLLRAYGNANAPLYFLIVSSVLNVALDLVFIGPLQMGVAGAAYATIVAQSISALLTMVYVSRNLPVLNIFKKGVKFDVKLLKSAIRIGTPNAAQQLLLGLSNIFVQRLVNTFGTVTMAAQGIEYRVSVFSSQIGNALSRAASTFAGQNKGAGKFERIEKAEKFIIAMSVVIGIIMTALVCFFDKAIVTAFIDDTTADGINTADVIIQGSRLVSMVAYSYVFMMVASVHLGFLRGAGDTLFTSCGTVSIVVIRILTAYLLAYCTDLGYMALGISMVVMWTLAMIGMYWRFKSGKWKTAGVNVTTEFE